MSSRTLCTLLLLGLCLPAVGDTLRQLPRTFPVGANPSAIAIADLDDDGLPEIVTADRGTLSDTRDQRPANDEVSVLLADEDFNYTKLQPSLKTGFAPYAVKLVNVDGLKWPEVVVVSLHAVRERDLTLHRNLPNNIFEQKIFTVPDAGLRYHRMRDGDGTPLFTMPGLTDVEVRDLDGDTYRDAVAAGWSSDVLVYFPGDPELYFGTPVLLPAPGGPRDLVLEDLNGDGHVDIAATLYAAGEVGLWAGAGDGTFTAVARFDSRGQLPHRIQVADFDGDGVRDLAVSHRHTDDSVVIFFGDGAFGFPLAQEVLLGENRAALECEPLDLVVGDFNADGAPDAAVACHTAGEVVVLLNTGVNAERLVTFRRERYAFEDAFPRALAAGDLDNDGADDLAVALGEANAVGVLITGDGQTERLRPPRQALPSGRVPAPLEPSDPELLLEPLDPTE